LVVHGRRPLMILRFVIHEYLAGREYSTMYQILGWSVLVRVDGLTYSFLGAVVPSILNGTVNLRSFFLLVMA